MSVTRSIRSELERSVQERWSLSIRRDSKREAKTLSKSLKIPFLRERTTLKLCRVDNVYLALIHTYFSDISIQMKQTVNSAHVCNEITTNCVGTVC